MELKRFVFLLSAIGTPSPSCNMRVSSVLIYNGPLVQPLHVEDERHPLRWLFYKWWAMRFRNIQMQPAACRIDRSPQKKPPSRMAIL